MAAERRRYPVIDVETVREEVQTRRSKWESVEQYQLEEAVNYINGHEEYHDVVLESRIRKLEDNQLWVVASAATIGAIGTIIIVALTIYSGLVKIVSGQPPSCLWFLQ